jgi:uncharacterized membrane protein
VIVAGYGAWLAILAAALAWAPWQALVTNRLQQVFLGALLALLALWHLRVGAGPALSLHLLAVTTLTLMFGWCLAVVGVSLVSLAFVLEGSESLATLPVSALASGVVPASLSYLLYRVVSRSLPRNPFIYIFLCGFLGGVIAALVNLPLKEALLARLGLALPLGLGAQPWAFLPLYAFPEGLLNGMLVTVLVVLRPEWLRTFSSHPSPRHL